MSVDEKGKELEVENAAAYIRLLHYIRGNHTRSCRPIAFLPFTSRGQTESGTEGADVLCDSVLLIQLVNQTSIVVAPKAASTAPALCGSISHRSTVLCIHRASWQVWSYGGLCRGAGSRQG